MRILLKTLFIFEIFFYLAVHAASSTSNSTNKCESIYSEQLMALHTLEANDYLDLANELDSAIVEPSLSVADIGSVKIKGKLGEVIYDQNGLPIYLRYMGPTELLDKNNNIIENQGTKIHRDGYSTPIGKISSLLVNEKGESSNALTEAVPGDKLVLTFQSGVKVIGTLERFQSLDGRPTIATLIETTVKYGERFLHKPNAGPFDMVLTNDINFIEPTTETANLNSKLIAKFYKTDVNFIRTDALSFYNLIKERFAKQKDKFPERPYGFAFEEGRHVINYMQKEVEIRISNYLSKGLYWRPNEIQKYEFYKLFKLSKLIEKQKQNLETELTFLKVMRADLASFAVSETIPYDKVTMASVYFVQLMQATQIPNSAYVRTPIYEAFHNSKSDDINKIWNNYQNQNNYAFNGGHYNFSTTYKQMFDPNNLNVVIVPVVGFLLSSDLIATRNSPVHFATVSGVTVNADGFVLDPLSLYLHDIYFHAGKRESNDRAYFKSKKLTPTQIDDFRIQQKVWINDFLISYKKVDDRKLMYAITQAAQTVSHDRGKAFAPSTFNEHQWANFYFIMKGEIYVTAWGQPNREIGPDLKEILPYMNQAYKWLNNFWKKYENSPY